jgi:undecaprenyl-diphosphatase
LTVSLAAVVGAGWVLRSIVQDVVVGDGSIRFDRPVLEWFARHREPWLTTTMRIVTVAGSSGFLIPLVLTIGASYWWRRRTSRPLSLLAAAYAGAYLLSQAIKTLTARARPPAGLAAGHFPGHAFPSGHATQAAAVYGMLAVVLASRTPRWRRKVAVWAAAVLTVTVVGITRLYLGAHWLTDVLGGWALGSLWLFLALVASHAITGMRAVPGPAPRARTR